MVVPAQLLFVTSFEIWNLRSGPCAMVHEAGTWAIIETIIKPGQILCQISCLRLHLPLPRYSHALARFFFFFVCHTSKALLFDVAVGSGKLAKPIQWRRDKMMASRAEELKNFKSLQLQILCISVWVECAGGVFLLILLTFCLGMPPFWA